MKRPRIVRVVWVDAAHIKPGEWVDKRPKGDDQEIETVGYLVRRTSRALVVAHSIDRDNGNATGVFSIPRSAVRKLRRLR